jgi:hypothetical protein
MFVTKTKNYSKISLDELKEDLRIDVSDDSYDSELLRLIKTAVGIAEKAISGDIVPTTNNLEDYLFCGSWYKIDDINISISSVQYTNNILTTPISGTVTGYSVLKFHNYALLKFFQPFTAEKLNIVYTSGYANEIPADLRKAVIIKIAELFDVDKTGYVSNTLYSTKAFDRLIAPHINLYTN